MAIHHVEATFLGSSSIFSRDHSYQLEIHQRWNGRFIVRATHGYDYKPLNGTALAYVHLGNLLQDWQILRVV